MKQQETLIRLCDPEEALVAANPTAWPAHVEMVMSAIEAGQFASQRHDRRRWARKHVKLRANLRLFIDGPMTPPWTLYTRDVHSRGLGFITPHRLPLGYGGMLDLPAADGTTVRVACTLLRCREAAPGWFEGSLYFNRQQEALAL